MPLTFVSPPLPFLLVPSISPLSSLMMFGHVLDLLVQSRILRFAIFLLPLFHCISFVLLLVLHFSLPFLLSLSFLLRCPLLFFTKRKLLFFESRRTIPNAKDQYNNARSYIHAALKHHFWYVRHQHQLHSYYFYFISFTFIYSYSYSYSYSFFFFFFCDSSIH